MGIFTDNDIIRKITKTYKNGKKGYGIGVYLCIECNCEIHMNKSTAKNHKGVCKNCRNKKAKSFLVLDKKCCKNENN